MIYTPSDKEDKRWKKFCKKHKACRPSNEQPPFEPISWILIPTGIGTVVKLVCPYCGEKEDITDVDCW